MVSQRHERISEVFLAVCALPAEEQAKALDERCAGEPSLRSEVQALLERDAEQDSAFLQSPALGKGFSVQRSTDQAEPEPSLSGTRIGHYHLGRVIASGGMGTVYEAQQDAPRRTLAVKVMKRGITSQSALKRFEYESQILAHLHHRGIAHVYESGRYEEGGGVPYFAMELIADAKPLTDFAKGHKLSTRQRLELFSKVCDAVHHGHQKGVIHRDLKPSNILVDAEGEPKIIDFGVARATDSDLALTTLQTDVGQLIGTLQYMSPEQCKGDAHNLDTRTDVFSLGVVLYELLCDRVPYDVSSGTMLHAIRVIREVAPARPSAINRTLRGDLETITLKALEKERRYRYDSAAALADDIRRYLDDEPIVARPASALYQFGKFARRNKALVGGAGMAAAATLAGLITVWWKNAQLNDALGELSSTNVALKAEKLALLASEASANLQRSEAVAARESEREARVEAEESEVRARTEAAKANTVVELLGDMLSAADPHAVKGANYTLRQVLDDFDVGLGDRLEDEPEVECTVRRTMGSAYLGLGLLDTAERHLSRSMELARGELQEDPNVLAECLQSWARLQRDRGRYAEAEDTLREELELLYWPGEESEDIADGMSLLAEVLRHLGRYGESERLQRDALAMSRRVLGEANAYGVASLALVLGDQGKYVEAERLHRQALEMARKLFGDEHSEVAACLSNLADGLENQGKYAESERLNRQALEMDRKLLGEEHPHVATAQSNLATVLMEQGKFAEAERRQRQALEMDRKLLGEEHPKVAIRLNNLASVLSAQEKDAEAERLFREVLETNRRQLGEEHPSVAATLGNLGVVLARQEKYAEAERLSRQALDMSCKLLGDDHPSVAGLLGSLTEICWAWLSSRREALGESDRETLTTQSKLGVLLWSQSSHGEAEPLLLDCLEKRTEVLGEDHPDTLASLYHVARLHESLQRWEEAEVAAGWLLELTPEDAVEYAEREQLLERVLEAQGNGE